MSTIAKFTLAEYDRIAESGAIDQRRLEFIRGEIREMTPIGPMHEDVLDRLNLWSIESVSPKEARVRVQQSIGLPEFDCAPEPDIAWVSPRSYAMGRPQAADVLLIIEVADSSLSYDRGDKAALYAQAGIPDYWVVNLRDRTIEVHRDPQPNGYRTVTVARDQDEVCPLAFPQASLLPATLWA